MTLINHGLDLKQRDPTSGKTVLHHWASPYHDCTEKDSLTIVKLLIEKGADVMAKDNCGFTPIMTAANRIDPHYHLDLAPLNLLLKNDDIAIMEKIEAMELDGANIFSYARNSPHIPKACYYWRRARHLRQVEGSGSYQKKLAQKSIGTVEWTTSDHLKHIIQHPKKYEIKMQSLLVQLRILSSRSWEAANHFLERYMRESDLSFASMSYKGKYLELLDIYWALLETILLFIPSEKGLWNTSIGIVSSLVDTLSEFKRYKPKLFNSEIIKKSIHLILVSDVGHFVYLIVNGSRKLKPSTNDVNVNEIRILKTSIQGRCSISSKCCSNYRRCWTTCGDPCPNSLFAT